MVNRIKYLINKDNIRIFVNAEALRMQIFAIFKVALLYLRSKYVRRVVAAEKIPRKNRLLVVGMWIEFPHFSRRFSKIF